MKSTKRLIFLVLPWVYFFTACEDSDLGNERTFIKFFGGSFNQKAYAFREASDGSIFIVGSSSSFGEPTQIPRVFVIKTDANGNRITQKFFGNGLDVQEGKDLAILDNGEILVLAYRLLPSRFYLLRLNAELDTIMTKSYGVYVNRDEKLYLRSAADGGFILLGTSPEPQNSNKKDMVLLKVDANLDSVYTRRYGLFEKDDIAGSLVIEDENIIWCGTSNRQVDDSDMRVLQADSSGELSWSFDFEEASDTKESGLDIQKVAQEKYIVVGSKSNSDNEEDIYVVEMEVNAQGFLKSTPRAQILDIGDGKAVGRSIFPTDDGGYVISGSFVQGSNPSSFLLKINADLTKDTSWPVNPRLFGADQENGDETSLCEKDQGEIVRQLSSDGGYLILNTICFQSNSVIALIKTDRLGKVF